MTIDSLMVIRGEDYTLDGQPLFWSNKDGWAGLSSADVYTDREVSSHKFNLPVGKCHWVHLYSAIGIHTTWAEKFALLSRKKGYV